MHPRVPSASAARDHRDNVPGRRMSAPHGADAAEPATMQTTWTTLQWTIE